MLPHSFTTCPGNVSVPCDGTYRLSRPFVVALLVPEPPAFRGQTDFVRPWCVVATIAPTSPTENGLTWVVVTEETEYPSISSHPDSGTKRMNAPHSSPHSLSFTTQTGLAWTITTDEAGAFSHTHTHTFLDLLHSTRRRCRDRGCSSILPPS